MYTAEETRQILITELKELVEKLESGCLDHSCDLVGHKPGSHTNGGCHCWKDIETSLWYCFTSVELIAKPAINKRCW